MQVSVETTNGLGRKMTVGLPADSIDGAVTERLQSLSKTAKINGFRAGKVPFQVVKKRFGPQVRSEVLGSLINSSFYDAVQKENLRPAGQPTIESGEDTPDNAESAFSFVATFEVFPEFEPVFNDAIKVEKPVTEVQQSDVDEMIESLRKQRMDYATVDRAAQDADQMIIDFLGRIDGEEFEGGAAEKAPLVLGSGSMIAGFEEQLMGLAAGDKKTITVTFPAEYQAAHLAGKDAEFDITVHEIKESHLPELDEEMIKTFGIEDGTLEGLQADIRKNMERELVTRVDNQVKTQIMDGLLELNPIDVPTALVGEEIQRQREQLMEQMPAESDASFLGDELFKDQAERRVRLGLVVGEIVQKQELTPEAAAVRSKVEQLAETYEDPQQVIDYYYSNNEMLKNVEALVLEEAVTAKVLEAATVTDKQTTFQELMNPPKEDGSELAEA
ncbi:MAG: trigger factor [Granulosicoccaceae bacterium]